MKIDRYVISGGIITKADYGAFVLAEDVRQLLAPARGEYRHEECDAVQERCLNLHHHGHRCNAGCELLASEKNCALIRGARK